MRSLEPHRAGARAETERKAIAEAQKIVAIWNARQAGGRALWFRGTLTLGGQLGTDRGIASGGALVHPENPVVSVATAKDPLKAIAKLAMECAWAIAQAR